MNKMPCAQFFVFEADSFGASVGVMSDSGLQIESLDGYENREGAAKASVRKIRAMLRGYEPKNVRVHDPEELAPESELGSMKRRTEWSGAPFSSVLNHFASFNEGSWNPPFTLSYRNVPPKPPYNIYTDGTYTPSPDQDDGRSNAGIGYIISGSNDAIYAHGAPSHVSDSLDSEYHAILTALMEIPSHEDATVYTDHRNVPTVEDGDAPERCEYITDSLISFFNETDTLSIEAVNRSKTRLADGLATAGTRENITLGTSPLKWLE